MYSSVVFIFVIISAITAQLPQNHNEGGSGGSGGNSFAGNPGNGGNGGKGGDGGFCELGAEGGDGGAAGSNANGRKGVAGKEGADGKNGACKACPAPPPCSNGQTHRLIKRSDPRLNGGNGGNATSTGSAGNGGKGGDGKDDDGTPVDGVGWGISKEGWIIVEKCSDMYKYQTCLPVPQTTTVQTEPAVQTNALQGYNPYAVPTPATTTPDYSKKQPVVAPVGSDVKSSSIRKKCRRLKNRSKRRV